MFQELSKLLATCASLTITLVANDNGTLNVVAIPKAKNDGENVALTTPLALTGTPEELDAEFATIISSFTDKRKSLAEQLEATESILEAAKKEASSKATSAVKKASKSASSPSTPVETENDDDASSDESKTDAGKPAATSAAPDAGGADNLWG